MKNNIRKKILIFIILQLKFYGICESTFEFVNQDIGEIIYAVSLSQGLSIICDDTVEGKSTFRFYGGDFNVAFDAFLAGARLYVTKTDSLWTVSKIRILTDDAGMFQIDAYDVEPKVLLERLSLEGTVPIVHDVLPPLKISVHISNVDILSAVKMIMKNFPEYEITQMEKYIQIKKEKKNNFNLEDKIEDVKIKVANNKIDLQVKNVYLDKLLAQVSEEFDLEFINLVKEKKLIDNINLNKKSFLEILELVCLKCGCAFKEIENVFYIFPVENQIDKIKSKDYEWHMLKLNYVDMSHCLKTLQERFKDLKTIQLKEDLFVFWADVNLKDRVVEFVNYFDKEKESYFIRLQYLKVEDLLKTLPPGIEKNQIYDCGNGTDFFLIGTKSMYESLKSKLEFMDKPLPRIKYDVLVIQFQDTKDSSWSNSFTVKQATGSDNSGVNVQIGPVVDLKFDVITTFGINFATKLQSAIENNSAKIFADTVLHGISGSNIKFQNTNTFRYRDSNVDVETGKTLYSGVTREIVAGLILEIKGWVSGDGMITSDVRATVSRQGSAVDEKGNPPITSEKIITTQVRSRSGEPVILSGLKQNDSTITETRVPFLSKLPLIGWMFKSFNKTYENTEVVIYLVPHIENDVNEKFDVDRRLENLFEKFFK